MIIAPPLLRLIEAAHAALEDRAAATAPLAALVPPAVDFHMEVRRVFEVMFPTAPLKGDGKPLVDGLTRLFDEQRKALDDMGRALQEETRPQLRDSLRRLENSTNAIVEDSNRLGGLEAAAPRQSPLPAVDQFIKVGINVLDEQIHGVELIKRFPLLVQTIQNLRADGQRFQALYDAPAELATGLGAALDQMEAGLGAFLQYFREAERPALLDGLRFVKAASADVMARLAAMDEIARTSSTFSRLLVLEEAYRALRAHREGRVPIEMVNRTLVTLHSLGGYYAGQVDVVARYPLRFAVRERLDALAQAVEALSRRADAWFPRAGADPVAVAGDGPALEAMRTAFENASDAARHLQQDLESAARALEGAPQIEEVVDLLGRVSVSSASPAVARERVEHYLDLQRRLVDDLDAAAGDPGAAEIKTLVLAQMSAVYEMTRFLEDGDEKHLRTGFDLLRELHPQIMRTHGDLQAAVDAQRQVRERTVTCFQCGASTPAAGRYCSRCHAVLPMVSSGDEIIYTDVTGGPPVAGTPQNLRRLQSIHDRAVDGADPTALLAELDAVAGQLQAAASDFDGRVGPRIARADDHLLAEYAQAFRGGLARMVDGVAAMREGIAVGRLDRLGSGLQVALSAGQEMHEAQLEMQAGLAAHG